MFTANTRVRDRTVRDGPGERWNISTLGYLGIPETGYALALFARLREEESPAWARELCPDVRSVFKQSARWLRQEGDTLIDEQTGAPTMLSDDELPPGFGPRR